jgi:multidrug efflux pump
MACFDCYGRYFVRALGFDVRMSQSELAPQEDQGLVASLVTGAPTATADQMQVYAKQIFEVAKSVPEYEQMFQITGVPTVNAGIGGIIFKTWEERKRSAPRASKCICKHNGTKLLASKLRPFRFPCSWFIRLTCPICHFKQLSHFKI